MRERVEGRRGISVLWIRPGVAAGVMVGAVSFVGSATAIDWDGNFAVDGDFGGNYIDPVNWVGNSLPPTNFSVEFDIAGIYTVNLAPDIVAGATDVTRGQVSFIGDKGNGLTNWQTASVTVEGNGTVAEFIELDIVQVVGTNTFGFAFDDQSGGKFIDVDVLTGGFSVGDSASSPEVLWTGGALTTSTANGFDGSININGIAADGGGLLTLANDTQVVSAGSLGIARVGSAAGDTISGKLEIFDGSDVTVNGPFLSMGSEIGTAELVVSGNGSTLTTSASTTTLLAPTTVTGTTVGSSLLRVASSGQATFNGTLDVRTGGTLRNGGGILDINGPLLVTGRVEHTSVSAISTVDGAATFDSGSVYDGDAGAATFNAATDFLAGSSFDLGGGQVTFNDLTTFDAGTSYTHTAGAVIFNASATVNPISLSFGADTATNFTAGWNVNDDVAFARRLRAGEDADTRSNINVGDGGVLRNTQIGTQSDLALGFNGRGDLTVTGDGLVDIYDDVIFGQNAGGLGNAVLTGDSELRVNRNGSGSNVFVGLSGQGVVTMSGSSTLTVGNDLLIQANNAGGLDASFLGFAPAGPNGSTPDTSVTVGNDLLIGTTTTGGTVGALLLNGQGNVDVGNLTRVRASGQLDLTGAAVITTQDFTTDTGAVLNLSHGELEVSGGLGTINHGTLVVGNEPGTTTGNAVFTVSNGATVNLASGLTTGQVDGRGFVTVTGINSQLRHNNTNTDTRIGNGGLGGLDVGSLGLAELGDLLIVGDGANGNGTVNVFGAQAGQPSILRVNGGGASSQIDIGLNDGTGEIIVSGGGYLETLGAINVGNADDNPNASRTLQVTGQGDGLGSQLFAREINVLNNQAKLIISGANARVDVTRSLSFSNGGDWTQSGGTLTVPNINHESGIITINGGTIRTGQFNGDFTNAAGTLTPDSGITAGSRFDNLNITGEYVQGDDATLLVQLGGTMPGTQHDLLIADVVTLQNGTGLEVELLDSFMPTLGDSFEVVLANGVFGTFGETIGLTLDGGLRLEVVYGLDRVTLNTVAGFIDGDYNGDGFVSQADLDLVLLNWGDSVIPATWLAAEQFDGVQVSQNELDGVLLNWGDGTPPHSAIAAIPEPATLAVMGLGLTTLTRRRTRAA